MIYADTLHSSISPLHYQTKQQDMHENNILLFQKIGISKVNNFNYSESVNAFIGNGYISAAGNTYMNEIRLLEGLLIKEDVGQGYAHSFLNGIRIFDLKTKQMLCEKSYHCTYYSQTFIKSEVNDMLFKLLLDASRKDNIELNFVDAEEYIKDMVNSAFSIDQRQILVQLTQKYLNI